MIFLCKMLLGKFGIVNNGTSFDTKNIDYSGNNANIYVTPYDAGIIPTYLICYYSWDKN